MTEPGAAVAVRAALRRQSMWSTPEPPWSSPEKVTSTGVVNQPDGGAAGTDVVSSGGVHSVQPGAVPANAAGASSARTATTAMAAGAVQVRSDTISPGIDRPAQFLTRAP